MQLYRVSDAEDDGPYKPASRGGVTGVRLEHDRDYINHPTPTEDPDISGIDKSEVCAFTSLSALYQWFDGWSQELTSAGYMVRVVDVPAHLVRAGSHGQAVYPRDAAQEIRTFPVSRHEHTYA